MYYSPNYTYHHGRVNNGMNSDSRANSASRLLTAPDSLDGRRGPGQLPGRERLGQSVWPGVRPGPRCNDYPDRV